MSRTKSSQGSAVETTARLFSAATEAGVVALSAYGNMVTKSREFISASYAAIVAAQALQGTDRDAALKLLFDDRKLHRPSSDKDIVRWFKGVAPDEFVRQDKFKSARTKYVRALSNAFTAKLSPDEMQAQLQSGGIHKLSLAVPARSAPAYAADSGPEVNAEGGPSPEQQRELDAEQDRPEELEDRAREAEEAAAAYRKAHKDVQAILHDPDRAPLPVSDYRDRVEVSDQGIVAAVRKAAGPFLCLAIVRVDPTRKSGEGIVGAEIESSAIDLLTADPGRIKIALARCQERPDVIIRTIPEIVGAIRGPRPSRSAASDLAQRQRQPANH